MILDRASIGKPRDWRWQRCTEAVQPGGKLRRSDDDGVQRGVSLLRGLRTCSTHRRRRNLARRDPELWAAYQMHMERDLRTAFLEALLPAGTPFEVVGRMADLSTGAVGVYARVFLAVSEPRRDVPAWSAVFHAPLGRFVIDALVERLRTALAVGETPSELAAESLCIALWGRLALALLAAHGRPLPPALLDRVWAVAREPQRSSAGADGEAVVRENRTLLLVLEDFRGTGFGGGGGG
jgi:hypothetical protein